MRLFKYNNEYATGDIVQTAERLKLPRKFVELLFSRSLNTDEKIDRYLNQDKNRFYDPYLLKGMTQAVKRIQQAAQNNEKVVVYGDYDADGICAAAILSLTLSKIGADVFVHIPDREGDGYGLSVDALEKIIEESCPDLIITCDCGISNVVEVEAVKDLGVDIIVTDHHNVSESVPDCTVINPKQSDCSYPFKDLCGAGVALKLSEALIGDEARDFLDIAAVATVADLMPLLDENRLIVQRGLKQLSGGHGNIGLYKLCVSQNLKTVTSSDIAFKIAPRINAAGRMGDPYRAFELLISDAPDKIASIIEVLNKENELRRDKCDKMYREALQIINQTKLNKRYIFIRHSDWEKGVSGIAAARLASEFRRPTFILIKSDANKIDSEYRGTSRGIAGVDIYAVLSSAQHLLTEFGGHCQAAGFSLKPQNIPALEAHIAKCMDELSGESFLPSFGYDVELTEADVTSNLVKCIERMEPFGNNSVKPLFLFRGKNLKPAGTNHLSITASADFSITAFNHEGKRHLLSGEKDLVIELAADTYRGGIKGILRAVAGEPFIDPVRAEAEFIKSINYKSAQSLSFYNYTPEKLPHILGGGIYCDLVIAGCKKTFDDFIVKDCAKGLLRDAFTAADKNNYSRVILSPEFDSSLPLTLYERVIFLDSPPGQLVGYINSKTDAAVYVPQKNNFADFLQDISFDREIFAKYYDIIRRNKSLTGANVYDYFDKLQKHTAEVQLKQLIVCLTVFIDLGFFTVNRTGAFMVNLQTGVKAQLTDSKIYCLLSERKKD